PVRSFGSCRRHCLCSPLPGLPHVRLHHRGNARRKRWSAQAVITPIGLESTQIMSAQLPNAVVPIVPSQWRAQTDDHRQWPWEELAPLPPFILANGSAPARQQTTVRIAYDNENFYVRF